MNTPPRSFLAPPPSTFRGDKPALRSRMREARRRLAAEQPNAAAEAAQAFADDPAPAALLARPKGLLSRWMRGMSADSAVAATYAPVGGELDPGPLEDVLAGLDVAVAHPFALAPDLPLIFRERRLGDALMRDAAGMLAPGPHAPEVVPSLLFLPCLAFDGQGGRLGQGGGYYDRTLNALRKRGGVTAIGLAYAGQEVDKLPLEPHDARLDGVLTERGLTLFSHHG